MHTKRLAMVAAATLVAALVPGGTAQADHSWGGYHWARQANPFTLVVADNVTSKWDAYLNTTVSDWNRSTVLDLAKVTGTTKAKPCRATSGRVEVCNANYGKTNWLGVASISISGKHITAGTVKVNDAWFDTPTYNTPAWRNLVMCQEVGHTLGLDHQDENFDNANLGTCMDYTSDPSSNQHPNAHDYAQLEAIYAHLDTTTTVGAAASASPAQVGNSASTWGRMVAGSRASGKSTYVRDFGHGDYVVTHVIWAR